MPDTTVVSITNHDIVFLVRHLDRFIEELMRSASAGVSGMIDADKKRLGTYIKAIRAALAWAQSTPQLDLPKTHPRQYELEPYPIVPELENDALSLAITLFESARIELVNSASARLASRLQSFDAERLTAVVDKIESLLVDYIDKAAPIDLPESSPQEAPVAPGRLGV